TLPRWKKSGALRSPPSCKPKYSPQAPNEMSADQDNEIHVRVLFFGAARDAVGCDEIALKLNSSSNTSSAREKLIETYPALKRFGECLLLAVNQEYARSVQEIRDGDELAIFPPVSGGSGEEYVTEAQKPGEEQSQTQDFYELTTDPINVG